LWVLLLRGKTPPSTAIAILGAILMSAAILWSQYLR
jgi:Zn-dependent membrane protease YugP